MPLGSNAPDAASSSSNRGDRGVSPYRNAQEQGVYPVFAEQGKDDHPQTQLFLGTQKAAQNVQLLHHHRISRVICVGTPAFYPVEFVYLEIPLLDMPSENLLVHVDKCVSFIDNAIRDGHNVLVNCVFAQSRSAAVVVAYLMRQKGLTLAEATGIARAAQPTVHINPGFRAQLALYQDMSCSLVAGKEGPPVVLTAHATYRWFLFADNVRSGRADFLSDRDVSKPLRAGESCPGNERDVRTAIGMCTARTFYRCKTCRAPLFFEYNVIDHLHPVVVVSCESAYESIARHGDGSSWLAATGAAAAAWNGRKVNQPGAAGKGKAISPRCGRRGSHTRRESPSAPHRNTRCTSVFTEVLSWVGVSDGGNGSRRGDMSGKITCPGKKGTNCGSKLGAWSLQGTACSCGQTVKPSLQFTLSRIEAANTN